MRRALANDEKCYGSEHSDVAIRLNNLVELLQDMNRLAEAEPLMRRAYEILAIYGGNHLGPLADRANLSRMQARMSRAQ